MSTGYKTYGQLNLPGISAEMLQEWAETGAFQKSMDLREGNEPFVFYEGPPSANGMPGIHHVISRTLKDLVCRYKTMQGFQVKRKGGWDTHGLPIELGVEKMLGITKEDIGKKISVEDYNKKCREVVMQYKDQWDSITQKMGYWVDLDNPYVTFENNYIETLWWCLSELYKKGYLYESVSIQPYSPAAGTGLSSHELNQPGTYKDVKDTSAVVMFKVKRSNPELSESDKIADELNKFLVNELGINLESYNQQHTSINRYWIPVAKQSAKQIIDDIIDETYFLAWTTTPWTLPSNLGLTVGPNIDYVLVRLWNQYTGKWFYGILAKNLLSKIISEKYLEDLVVDIYNAQKGHKIEGSKYIPDGYFIHDGIEHFIEVKKNLDNSKEGLLQLLAITKAVKKSKGIFYSYEPVDEKIQNEYSEIQFRSFWGEYHVIAEFKGSELEGIEYEQLMPFEANTLEQIQLQTPNAKPFRVILGDFVTTEDGTGIVHTAPAFGADDYKVGQKNNLGILTLVDKQGKFVDGTGEFSGRYVKDYKNEKNYTDVNIDISVKLKKENRAFKVEKYEHSYPHCWRTDKPIIYYPLDAWFIKTTAVKDRMVELNKTINWKPASTGTGRFGNWLENMVDWNLSRSRYWGTPLPIWRTAEVLGLFKTPDPYEIDKPNLEFCIGKKEDLKGFVHSYNLGGIDISKEVVGYIFRLDEINQDLKSEDGELWKRWHAKNLKLNPDQQNIMDELIFGINAPFLKQNLSKRQGVTLGDLAHAQVDLNDLIGYYTKVDDEVLKSLDLHKPIVDNIGLVYGETTLLYRVPDLIDVWFDSGAMPYAQWGLNKEKLIAGDPFPFNADRDRVFPADFIAEGVDQTRGWFYTLHALAVLLFDSVAYKTVVSNGLVLDKSGNKMSKRLGNVVDPFGTIDSYGADATRWYLITNASPWDSLKFDEEGIKEVQRKFFGTLYNTYQFFALYANVDGFAFKEEYIPVRKRPEIDQWILSSLNSLIKTATENFDAYEPTVAGRAIEEFVDTHLSNWYVRLCRRRFWKGEYEHDKISAYQTLYECLETLSRLIAPIAPFFGDWLYKNLNDATKRFEFESVHHAYYPKADEAAINESLEKRMQLAQDASSLVLSLRKKVNIKVRQPLQKIFIPATDSDMAANVKLVEDIIKTETNIKEVEILDTDNDFIRKKAKANFKTLGKKLGPKMKWAADEIAKFDNAKIGTVLEGNYVLNPDRAKDEEEIIINAEDLEVITDEIPGYEIASKGSLTVALDITITDILQNEGNARELVNRIQNIRKDSGFELTDRVTVLLSENEALRESLIEFKPYICAEILADSLEFSGAEIEGGTEIEVNDTKLTVKVSKKQ